MISSEQILADLLRDGNRDAATLPHLLCEQCTEELPVTGTAIALMSDEGHEGMVAATDGPARELEELQFTLGEGPCIDSSRTRSPVLQPELARTATAKWPGFGRAVLDAGIAAVFAFPLQVGAIRLGVLDLYRATAGSLYDDELRTALSYADAAVIILLHLQDQAEPGEGVHPQLATALGNRPEIHMATGMISVQAAVGLTEALLLLRGRAFSSERPIMDVARDVLTRKLRFGADGHD